MRVSHYTRLSAVTLLVVSVAFVALLFWSQNQLNAANGQRLHYQIIKESASLGVISSLQNYLLQGNAALLVEAETNLQALQQQLTQLPQEIAEPVEQHVLQLLQKTQTDYRAIGKLSGDPMALLKIAEQEMLNSTRGLLRYASEGYVNNPNVAALFTESAADSARLIYQLSQARVQLLNGQSEAQQHMDSLLSQFNEVTRALQKLPLLAVYHQQEIDEFALGEQETVAEEKGELLVADLASLVRRYPSELSRTSDIASQKIKSLAMLDRDLSDFQEQLAKGELQVSEAREQVLQKIKLAAGAMVAVLLLLTMANYMMQRGFVLQPLRQLREAFHQLVETNELTAIEVRNKTSEMGEIAMYFNQLITRERQQMAQRLQQLQVVSESLSAISDQVSHISDSNHESEQQIIDSRQNTQALAEITQELSRISALVETNARDTESAMSHSLDEVTKVIQASEQTAQAAEQGYESLANLTRSVGDVSVILDVIRVIAEQTNLLALNAAIESARAGEHGRGFAVVADEVRQLAMKTQTSLKEITAILNSLDLASSSLATSITQVQQASSHQRHIAEQLHTTSNKVREQSQQAVNVTHQAFTFVKEQEQQVAGFNLSMDAVQQQVEQASALATRIQDDVKAQAERITQTLNGEESPKAAMQSEPLSQLLRQPPRMNTRALTSAYGKPAKARLQPAIQ